jgi:hypothetical protein
MLQATKGSRIASGDLQRALAERQLEREEERVKRAIEEKEKSGNEVLDHKPTFNDASTPVNGDKTPPMEEKRKRRRWDEGSGDSQRALAERQLEREEERVKRAIEEKEKSGGNEVLDHKPTLKGEASTPVNGDKTPPMEKKRRGEAGTRAAPTKPQSPRLKFKRNQRSRKPGLV